MSDSARDASPARLRVLLAAYVPNDEHSGMGSWAHRMAGHLVASGHEPTLWFREDFPLPDVIGRWAVLLYPVALAWRVWAARRDVDVIAIHEPSGFWCTLLRSVLPHYPAVVAVCHNVEPKVWQRLREAARAGYAVPTRWGRFTGPLLRHWQSRGTVRRSDRVVCLSEEDRAYLIERRIAPADRVRVVPNGVDVTRTAARSVQAGAPRVLIIGGWLDVKGRRLVPAIWQRVRDRLPTASLTLAGTGIPADVVLTEFRAADRSSVSVIPRVTDSAEMAHLCASHGTYLLPSLSEGSPLALLEAMASGMAVVASAVGGVKDLVRHEQEGLLFQSMDVVRASKEVVRLAEEHDLAAALASAAQAVARDRSWSRTAALFEQCVEEAASQRTPPARWRAATEPSIF